jgi:hypothetical protein
MITALGDFCNVFDDFSNGFNRLPVIECSTLPTAKSLGEQEVFK